MEVTKIKKQSITQNTKPNNDKYPLKNNKTIAYHKRKNIKQNSSKKLNDKRYSISFIENSISKESKIKPNHSFDNSLELDYLFSYFNSLIKNINIIFYLSKMIFKFFKNRFI